MMTFHAEFENLLGKEAEFLWDMGTRTDDPRVPIICDEPVLSYYYGCFFMGCPDYEPRVKVRRKGEEMWSTWSFEKITVKVANDTTVDLCDLGPVCGGMSGVHGRVRAPVVRRASVAHAAAYDFDIRGRVMPRRESTPGVRLSRIGTEFYIFIYTPHFRRR
jgi:hypothetical protein